ALRRVQEVIGILDACRDTSQGYQLSQRIMLQKCAGVVIADGGEYGHGCVLFLLSGRCRGYGRIGTSRGLLRGSLDVREPLNFSPARSEERRVGEEWRTRVAG